MLSKVVQGENCHQSTAILTGFTRGQKIILIFDNIWKVTLVITKISLSKKFLLQNLLAFYNLTKPVTHDWIYSVVRSIDLQIG